VSTFAVHRLPRATVWRFAFLLAQGGMSLLLFSVLAHMLPASQFAPTAIAQGVLVIAQAVSDFGLSQAAVIALPSSLAARPQDAPNLMRGASLVFMVAAVAAFVLVLLAVAVVPPSARLPVALIAPASSMSVVVAGSDGILRAVGEFRRPVILVSLSRAGSFLGVLAAIGGSAWLTCAGISLGTLLASLPASLLLLRRYRAGTTTACRELVRTALPLGFGDLLMMAAGRLNTIWLSAISGTVAGAGFESAWRLFQLSLYVVGGLATGAAPFVAHALGAGHYRDLSRILRRVGAVTVLSGLALGLGIYIVRYPVSEVLFGRLGEQVAGAITPLAVLTPLCFAGFLATMVLAASARDRWVIVAASAFGAVINLVLVIILVPSRGLQGGALACAIGLGVAQIGLLLRLSKLMRRLRRSALVVADPVSGGTATTP
jgi:O-antigen/teichoic acid export membrane protein